MKKKHHGLTRTAKESKYKPSFQASLAQLQKISTSAKGRKLTKYKKVNEHLTYCQNYLRKKSHGCSFAQLVKLGRTLANLPVELLRNYHELLLVFLCRIRSSLSNKHHYTRNHINYILLFNNLLKLPMDFDRHVDIFALISLKCLHVINNTYEDTMRNNFNLSRIAMMAHTYYPNDSIVMQLIEILNPHKLLLAPNQGAEFTPETSAIQRTVTKTIEKITTLAVSSELSLGCYYLDIALTERKLCIEVDGPHHYEGQSKHMLRATDQFRDFILTTLGWDTIRLPAYQCFQALTNHMLQAYLVKQLAFYNVVKPEIAKQKMILPENLGEKFSAQEHRAMPLTHKIYASHMHQRTYTQSLQFAGIDASKELTGYNARAPFSLSIVFYSRKQTCKLFFFRHIPPKKQPLKKTGEKQNVIATGKRK